MKSLDTSVAIDHLRGTRPAVELLAALTDDGETIAASEVVRFELLARVRDREAEALEQFFSALIWVPVDENITRAAGHLARRHGRAYSRIDDADYLIATTAVLLDAPLLTTNMRHFPMLKDLRPAY